MSIHLHQFTTGRCLGYNDNQYLSIWCFALFLYCGLVETKNKKEKMQEIILVWDGRHDHITKQADEKQLIATFTCTVVVRKL